MNEEWSNILTLYLASLIQIRSIELLLSILYMHLIDHICVYVCVWMPLQ